MPLTEAQQAKAIEVVRSKAPRLVCPGCGENEWTIGPEISLVQLGPRPAFPAPMSAPSVVLVCSTCGNTLFFNVHVLGIAAELGVPPPGEPLKNA